MRNFIKQSKKKNLSPEISLFNSNKIFFKTIFEVKPTPKFQLSKDEHTLPSSIYQVLYI